MFSTLSALPYVGSMSQAGRQGEEVTMKNQNVARQRGFNLIEIAIVLAVIGLIIGGIYTAAAAVTENNRRRNTQAQILTIVQNIRTAYATQAAFAAPTNANINTMRLYPGDLVFDGTNFQNAYGGTVTVAATALGAGGGAGSSFQLSFSNVSQGGCIEILSKAFGSQVNTAQVGLVAANGGAAANPAGGITIAEATTACSADPTTLALDFALRG